MYPFSAPFLTIFASVYLKLKDFKNRQADSLPTDRAIAEALDLSYHHRASLSKGAEGNNAGKNWLLFFICSGMMILQ